MFTYNTKVLKSENIKKVLIGHIFNLLGDDPVRCVKKI